MPFQKICTLTEIKMLTDDIALISIDAPEISGEAKPGQFVNISCGASHILRRPISICNVSGTVLTVVVQNRGEGTAWLLERTPGDELDILGPLGHGFSMKSGKSIVIGGGIGVPPMLYTAKCAETEPDAILGFRNADAVILTDEFKEVCGNVTVTTDDGSFGEKALVTVPLERMLKTGGYSSVMCCGPTPMLKAIASICGTYGVYCEVSMEQRMGCGVGACLVCACKTHSEENGEKMSRVCKDGPVFDSREVEW